MKEKIVKIQNQLSEKRVWGKTVVMVEDLSAVRYGNENSINIADEFMEMVKYRRIGNGWRMITRENAFRVANHILQTNLAFEVSSDFDFNNLVSDYFSLFSDSTTFLFNGNFNYSVHQNSISELQTTSVSGATFDATICSIDEKKIGILQVMDED